MNRAALLNQLARCNERIDQTDRNVFAQAKRVAAATAAGADVSISRDLLKRFGELTRPVAPTGTNFTLHIPLRSGARA